MKTNPLDQFTPEDFTAWLNDQPEDRMFNYTWPCGCTLASYIKERRPELAPCVGGVNQFVNHARLAISFEVDNQFHDFDAPTWMVDVAILSGQLYKKRTLNAGALRYEMAMVKLSN